MVSISDVNDIPQEPYDIWKNKNILRVYADSKGKSLKHIDAEQNS